MANAEIQLNTVKCVGKASCVGGLALHPALGDYPLLQWSAIDPVHPGKVMLAGLDHQQGDIRKPQHAISLGVITNQNIMHGLRSQTAIHRQNDGRSRRKS